MKRKLLPSVAERTKDGLEQKRELTALTSTAKGTSFSWRHQQASCNKGHSVDEKTCQAWSSEGQQRVLTSVADRTKSSSRSPSPWEAASSSSMFSKLDTYFCISFSSCSPAGQAQTKSAGQSFVDCAAFAVGQLLRKWMSSHELHEALPFPALTATRKV